MDTIIGDKRVAEFTRHKYEDCEDEAIIIQLWTDSKKRRKNGKRLPSDYLGEIEIYRSWLTSHPEFGKALANPESIPLTDW